MGGPPLEAELYRLKGEALLAGAGALSEAETAIEKAIDVARRQNAKSWELRAAISLARLRRQQGRPQEAVALLAPILGWFTEGFDTADLKEAKALLDELTEPPNCIGGRQLCRASVKDLRGASLRAVPRPCPLREWMGARRLWRRLSTPCAIWASPSSPLHARHNLIRQCARNSFQRVCRPLDKNLETRQHSVRASGSFSPKEQACNEYRNGHSRATGCLGRGTGANTAFNRQSLASIARLSSNRPKRSCHIVGHLTQRRRTRRHPL
jgi:hypothetical protein